MARIPAQPRRGRQALTARLAGRAGNAPAVVLGVALLVTAALAVPFLTMAPDEFASQEPEGPVFEARDELVERFGAGTVGWFFIVEARDGEMLDRDSLVALHGRLEALRSDARYGAMLADRTDPVTGKTVAGTVTLADALDRSFAQAGLGGLDGAGDAAVRAAASEVIDARGPVELGISAQATRDEASGEWSAPALTVPVLVDGDRIAGRGADAGFGTDVAVEEAGREVQALLRDSDALDVWGVALDQALTSEEQGQAAGPFIGLTVLAIVLLVGVAFRNYWTLALVGGALVALLVWLQGLANLIGLKQDQILATVVPIAMIAFGVDYAFHAVGRYREERGGGEGSRGALPADERHAPRPALARGLAGVAPALLLALATGAFAFLANTASGIESIIQFGIAAAVALASAFVVLGIAVPVAVAVIDERVGRRRLRRGRALAVAGGLAAAATAMTAVLFTVFLSPPVGLALLAGYLVAFVAVPVLVAGRLPQEQAPAAEQPGPPASAGALGGGRVGAGLARAVTAVAGRRAVVLPVVGVLSVAAAAFAVQVPASFDVEDFFAADTDFVVGLDKLDQHVGDQGGEEAVILVSTDLTDPAAVSAVGEFADRVADLDTDLLAHDADGQVLIDRDALAVVEGTSPLTPAEAAQVVAPPDGDGLRAARLAVGIVGSRAQENVEASRDLLEPLVADLDTDLAELQPGSSATLTGTPIVRQASLDAVSRSLQVSVPVAVLLCLLVGWAFMRSLRYALVSLVPILLVVAWLYGFMYVAGFSVNLVTATIGAISIGVGIDFAIHLTMRYREELARRATRRDALHAAAAGTGVALVASTVSSATGFAILAFAPMPMFASYGLLTAVMITLALLASLLVLPGLLLMVSREPREATPSDDSPAPGRGSRQRRGIPAAAGSP